MYFCRIGLRRFSTAIAAVLVAGVTGARASALDVPQSVSPGARQRAAGVRDGCPTFSWSALAGATQYELAVYALKGGETPANDSPAMRVELPSTSSFTPALEDCLAPGQYAWLVRAERESRWSDWSEPLLFEVRDAAVTPEVRRAAEEILNRWLRERGDPRTEAGAPRDTGIAAAPAAAALWPAAPASFAAHAPERRATAATSTPQPCAEFASFADVPASSPYCGWIEQLYRDGLTAGCGTSAEGLRQFCPLDSVTRQQLAMFVGKVLQARSPRQLDAGGSHNCVQMASGRLACWGSNVRGQSTPAAGLFVSVSAGGSHTCGVLADRTVACWGNNDDGQSTPPAGVFRSVSAGSFHTCGVKEDGTVACWGSGDYGQSTPPAEIFLSVSAGGSHTCGVKEDGSVACWGHDGAGQSTPSEGTFLAVSAGWAHTCGVRGNGTVACWGNGDYGQSTPPVGIFLSVSAGGYHSCGAREDGTAACWGRNDHGQSTSSIGTFVSVSAGNAHSCGVKWDGTVVCWGDGAVGQTTPPGWL